MGKTNTHILEFVTELLHKFRHASVRFCRLFVEVCQEHEYLFVILRDSDETADTYSSKLHVQNVPLLQ